MFYGIHPVTKQKVSVQEWELKYKTSGLEALCPICDNSIFIRNSSAPQGAKHFVHYPGTDCPTVESNRKKYEGLSPNDRDHTNAALVKKQVFDNLYLVYLTCRDIMNGKLKHAEFSSMLETANEREIWLYKGFTFEYVPYVLLVCFGIFNKRGTDRKERVYFVFDANLSNYDDLWNHRGLKKKIWRVLPDIDDVEEIPIKLIKPEPDYFKGYCGKHLI